MVVVLAFLIAAGHGYRPLLGSTLGVDALHLPYTLEFLIELRVVVTKYNIGRRVGAYLGAIGRNDIYFEGTVFIDFIVIDGLDFYLAGTVRNDDGGISNHIVDVLLGRVAARLSH